MLLFLNLILIVLQTGYHMMRRVSLAVGRGALANLKRGALGSSATAAAGLRTTRFVPLVAGSRDVFHANKVRKLSVVLL